MRTKIITDNSYYKHITVKQVQANSIRNGAPIFHSQIVKIGAKSEHFCHLPRYRSTAPIIGAAKDSDWSLAELGKKKIILIFSKFMFFSCDKQLKK